MNEQPMRMKEAGPLGDREDDGVAVLRGLLLGLAISLALWLLPLSA